MAHWDDQIWRANREYQRTQDPAAFYAVAQGLVARERPALERLAERQHWDAGEARRLAFDVVVGQLEVRALDGQHFALFPKMVVYYFTHFLPSKFAALEAINELVGGGPP